jgi:integrase
MVFSRPGMRLPHAEVLAAGEWLHAHSEFVPDLTVAGVERVLDDFRVNLDGSSSAKNVRVRKRNAFHMLLEHTMKNELLPSNLMDKADTRDFRAGAVTPIDRRIVMDPVQAAAFLRNIGYDPVTGQVEGDDRYTAFVALMLFEGLRPSEASAVRADWLELPMRGWGLLVLENAIVQGSAEWSDDGEAYSENALKWTDHSSRNEKTRDVPLSPETVAILRRHLALYGTAADGRLTSAREGGPMNSNLLSRLMEKARNRTFADPNSPHHIPRANHPLRSMTGYHCRHTAGSTMLNAGVPATLVAERMGHDVQMLLSTYAKVIEADKDRANGRIDAYRAEHFSLAGGEAGTKKSGKKKACKKKASARTGATAAWKPPDACNA